MFVWETLWNQKHSHEEFFIPKGWPWVKSCCHHWLDQMARPWLLAQMSGKMCRKDQLVAGHRCVLRELLTLANWVDLRFYPLSEMSESKECLGCTRESRLHQGWSCCAFSIFILQAYEPIHSTDPPRTQWLKRCGRMISTLWWPPSFRRDLLGPGLALSSRYHFHLCSGDISLNQCKFVMIFIMYTIDS